ncbi:MAG TPA: hotdog fold thioesterase [Candidatus Bathyarchaeia archaeon]|nr:hotdog fold thioesterase [Candidatus Bathyarchaeia archaeon]
MTTIEEYFKKDKYAELTGIKLLEISEGRARAMLEIDESNLNSAGTVQGGAIFTLADFAFAAAAHSHGTVAVAINSSISFFKAVSGGILYADAKEISFHPKLASYIVDVTNERNELIATFQGMVYRKKDKLKIE